MNKAEKVLILISLILVSTTTFIIGYMSMLPVQLNVKRFDYHEIWLDSLTGETVVTQVIMTLVTCRNERKEIYQSLEVYRDISASKSIQWTIDSTSGIIFFKAGTYIINTMIVLDSFTIIHGARQWQTKFNSTISPAIKVASNAKCVTITNLSITLIED